MSTMTLNLSRPGGLSWVTWRQHRIAMLGVVVLLGGLGVFLLLSGLAMHHDYRSLGVAACADPNSQSCAFPSGLFSNRYSGWAMFLPRFFMFIPGALGVFVGAPLVARELEAGTFRFAWTQGRSRGQWIVTKLVLLGVVLTALALAFSALFSWWFGPWDRIMGRMVAGQAYEVTGVVFAARTLFAFTLGAFLGAVIRRTVPAMAATAAAWLAVAWPGVAYLRPLIKGPLVVRADKLTEISNTWTIKDWYQDPAGHHISATALTALSARAKADGVTTGDGFTHWLMQHGYTQWVSYQPNDRFWHFQLIEGSGYLGLALILAAVTVWWVRRRTA